MEISGKAAVVVGGASGMAKATAEMLAREGAQVSILDLPTSKGAEVAKELGGSFHACDVTDFDGTEAALAAAWAFVPGWLQARRGSHIVITTIMFNFLASALMVYLLVNVLIKPGQMAPETRELAEAAWLPRLGELLPGELGAAVAGSSPARCVVITAIANTIAASQAFSCAA